MDQKILLSDLEKFIDSGDLQDSEARFISTKIELGKPVLVGLSGLSQDWYLDYEYPNGLLAIIPNLAHPDVKVEKTIL